MGPYASVRCPTPQKPGFEANLPPEPPSLRRTAGARSAFPAACHHHPCRAGRHARGNRDWKSVVSGKSVSVSVDLGGLGLIKKKNERKVIAGYKENKKGT